MSPVMCGDLAHPPFGVGTCAAVTMFHALEHLYDRRAYLESAHALLKPKGRLIVQVPNASCWQFRLAGPRPIGMDVPRHLTDFRTNDLEAILSSAGFAVVRRKYFSRRDDLAALASSLVPALDPKARRVRAIPETGLAKLLKDLLYSALLAGTIPFTLLEAGCHAGSNFMIEARKKP